MSNVIPAEFSRVSTLCTAKEAVIGSQVVLSVDARALHSGLGVGRDFSNWIKGRINSLGLEEGVDFEFSPELAKTPVSGKTSGGGRPAREYTLTLEAAKHIAMVEKNEMGRLIRSYFIWVEKQRTESALALSADTRKVLGGMIKSISRAQMREELAEMESRITNLVVTHQAGTAAVTDKTAKEWCEEYGLTQKGRNGPRRKIGNALSALAKQKGIVCHRCARTGTWLYPAELARPYMDGIGRHIIKLHNDAVLNGQPDLGLGNNRQWA